MEMAKRKFDEDKAAALAWNKKLTPRAHLIVDVAKVASRDIPSSNVAFSDDSRKKGTVKCIKSPHILYSFNLDEVSKGSLEACSCGIVQSTGLPCLHCCAAARVGGTLLEDYVSKYRRTDTWKKQYASLEFKLPSQADVEKHRHLFNLSLRLPPVLKKAKGRPRKNARKRTFVDDLKRGKSKKRRMTCRACFADGHTKRKCLLLASSGSTDNTED